MVDEVDRTIHAIISAVMSISWISLFIMENFSGFEQHFIFGQNIFGIELETSALYFIFRNGKTSSSIIFEWHALAEGGKLFPKVKEVQLFTFATRWLLFADLAEIALGVARFQEAFICTGGLTLILKVGGS